MELIDSGVKCQKKARNNMFERISLLIIQCIPNGGITFTMKYNFYKFNFKPKNKKPFQKAKIISDFVIFIIVTNEITFRVGARRTKFTTNLLPILNVGV